MEGVDVVVVDGGDDGAFADGGVAEKDDFGLAWFHHHGIFPCN